MPAFRKLVKKAVARRGASKKNFNEEFYALNPRWKGREKEARANQWASRAPPTRMMEESAASHHALQRAMGRRKMLGPVRKALNPKAAARLRRMKAAKKP